MRDHVSLILGDEPVSGILELRSSLVAGISNPKDQLLHHPHITIASFENHDNHSIPSSIEYFAQNQATIPLSFNFVGVFVGKAFVVSPIPSVDLLELQINLQRAIDSAIHVPAHLQPGNWVPHITLISPYTTDDHEFILRRLAKKFRPISGAAIGLLVDHHEADGEFGEDLRRFIFAK